jgi:hypothetical protein
VSASVFPAISSALSAILKMPEIIARFAGANKRADQLKKIHDAIQPYLKYLSIFNVQKK